MLQIVCVKLVADEVPHYLAATEVREDFHGDMEVWLDDERIAWYRQSLVDW